MTNIGENAFEGCKALTSITIPNSVSSIGHSPFEGCTGLTSITVDAESSKYDSRNNCNAIIDTSTNTLIVGCKNTIIPHNVTHIGDWAFSGCSNLTSITIPNSVTSIGDWAFRGCSGLTSITIPNSVTSIGICAFVNCTSFTSITIPYSVTSIGNYALGGCTLLTSITVDIENSNYDSRDNCNAIIETSTNTLIAGCKNTIIPNSVTSIEKGAFYGCSGLTSITIPNSVTSIGVQAFARCSSLTSIIIPNSVTSIEDWTFEYCSHLTSITIPSSVTTIGRGVFDECSNQMEVFCYAEKLPSTSPDSFRYHPFATLYVPSCAINDYKTTEPWNQFGTIKTIEEGVTKKCATPTISYHNGKLTFNCETEGVEYRSSITDADINDYTTQEINLSVTYTIKVYAMKSGCQNSDVATGTLCWIDVDPRKEGITDGVAQVKAMPVLIKSHGGQLTVEGAADDTTVSVYNAAGVEQGSAVSKNGQATINTSLNTGSVAIVKIGKRAVKVVMR